jgi:hypothetical protein
LKVMSGIAGASSLLLPSRLLARFFELVSNIRGCLLPDFQTYRTVLPVLSCQTIFSLPVLLGNFKGGDMRMGEVSGRERDDSALGAEEAGGLRLASLFQSRGR